MIKQFNELQQLDMMVAMINNNNSLILKECARLLNVREDGVPQKLNDILAKIESMRQEIESISQKL
jgi:hypothetical protein